MYRYALKSQTATTFISILYKNKVLTSVDCFIRAYWFSKTVPFCIPPRKAANKFDDLKISYVVLISYDSHRLSLFYIYIFAGRHTNVCTTALLFRPCILTSHNWICTCRCWALNVVYIEFCVLFPTATLLQDVKWITTWKMYVGVIIIAREIL